MTGYSPDSERSGLDDPLAFLDDTQEPEPLQRRRTVDQSREEVASAKVEAAEQSVGKRRRNLASPVPASRKQHLNETGEQDVVNEQALGAEAHETEPQEKKSSRRRRTPPTVEFAIKRRPKPIEMIVGKHGHTAGLGGPTVQLRNPALASATAEPVSSQSQPRSESRGRSAEQSSTTVIDLNDSLAGMSFEFLDDGEGVTNTDALGGSGVKQHESRDRWSQGSPNTFSNSTRKSTGNSTGNPTGEAFDTTRVGAQQGYTESVANRGKTGISLWQIAAVSCVVLGALLAVLFGFDYLGKRSDESLLVDNNSGLGSENVSMTDGGTQASNSSVSSSTAQLSLSEQTSNAIASLDTMISERKLIEAEQFLSSLDLVVYGYGQPEFDVIKQTVATLKENPDASIPSIERLTALDPATVEYADAVATDLGDESLANVEAIRLAETQAAAAENERLALEQIEQARLAQEAAQLLAQQAASRIDAERIAQETAQIKAEAARIVEETRLAKEAARLAEQQRVAQEARKLADERQLLEEQRQAAEVEAARIAEEKRILDEAAVLAEQRRVQQEKEAAAQREAQLAEESRVAAEATKAAEQAKIAERQKLAEEARLEQERLAEQQRVAEALKFAEQARIVEQQKLAEAKLLEQQRIEQQRIEQQRIEQQRIEQQRIEQQRIEQQRIEQQRIEQQRIEQQRIEQQRIEQQRIEQQRIEQAKAEADAKVAEEASLAQEKRLQAEAEQRRQAQARVREAARLATQRRLAENAAREAQRVAEATRLKELERTEERARQVELAQQRARLRQKAAEEQQRLAEQARLAALAREKAEVRRSTAPSRPITVTTVKEVEAATVQRNQPISDKELADVYRRFQALEKALESKDMTQVVRLTEQSSTKIGVFLQLFQNFESMDIRIEDVSAQSSNSTVVGRLRIMTMQRSNGDSAIPSDLYRDTLIESTREANGRWSRIRW